MRVCCGHYERVSRKYILIRYVSLEYISINSTVLLNLLLFYCWTFTATLCMHVSREAKFTFVIVMRGSSLHPTHSRGLHLSCEHMEHVVSFQIRNIILTFIRNVKSYLFCLEASADKVQFMSGFERLSIFHWTPDDRVLLCKYII